MVTIGPACAAQSALNGPAVEFHIPPMPLDVALNRYGDATGREALYDTSLTTGRVSGDVEGLLTPDAALKKLLAGSGLSAQFVGDNSFVLLPMPPSRERAAAQPMSLSQRRYYGLLQRQLLSSLCSFQSAWFGRYRFVAMLWIGADGQIEKSRRIGSVGAAEADRQIDTTLNNVRFTEPPPAGFTQPVLILIVPQTPGVTPACGKREASPQSDGVP